MRTHINRFISLLLTFALCLSMGVPAFAAESTGKELTPIATGNVYIAAQNVFDALDENQKEEFLLQIEILAVSGDRSLVEFHKSYVDPDYQFDAQKVTAISGASRNAASVAQQLQALNLPTAVYYGLLAFATSLGVPVGNVVDVVIGLGLGAIILANWDAIANVWDDIVDIFVDSFGSFVLDAFNYLKALVKGVTLIEEGEELPNQGEVSDDDHLDSPPVDAGSQGKHVVGHNNEQDGKSKWPEGENGVKETQEAWDNGTTVKNTTGEEVRTYDFGRVVGPNGETRVKVHMKKSTGLIHGYPVF